MTNKEIIELTDNYVAQTYNRFPIAIVKGEGSKVWDGDGKEYLDFVAGLAVTNLGHCHPKIVEAIRHQAGELIHISNLYHIGPQAELAKLLCDNSFANRVFFCNSGAESIEAAIKLARKYFSSQGINKSNIISMERSFHGRTMAALAATAQKKVQKGFEPHLQSFTYVPFGDIKAVEEAITPETAAVLIEPIQGEGGVNMVPDGFLAQLRELTRKAGVLLIFDEVQVGMGRTGTLFAYEHFGVEPEIMTLAKGLAGGVSIGAMLATEEVAKAFTPGTHATTFGGNPLATAAGSATIKAILDEGLLDSCTRVGTYLVKCLEALKEDFPFIKKVRGKGLIVGMVLSMPGGDIVKDCMIEGLLINCTADTVLRFLPALTVTEDEVDRMIVILRSVLSRVK